MASDFRDILELQGITPNEDAKDNTLLAKIDEDLFSEVKSELFEDYSIQLTSQEIEELMETHGIDFEHLTDYSVADLLYEILQDQS